MSMPRWLRRNQEPEPVRPTLARLSSGDAAPIGDPVAILSQALTEAQEEAARWKRHADTYDTERAEATALSHQYRDEVERITKERDGAYRERAQLLAWLAALHPSSAVITAARDVDEEGWHLLYLVAGGWQMSWHIAPADVPLFGHVELVEPSDPRAQWDGHGTEQKYQRIRQHVRLLALDGLCADEASTPVTTTHDTAVVAYRSTGGRLLRCLAHAPHPGQIGIDFHPVTSEDLPDGGICTHPGCGVDVLLAVPEVRSA